MPKFKIMYRVSSKFFKILFYIICVSFISCSDSLSEINIDASVLNKNTTGSGFFEYTNQVLLKDKIIKTFYHIPTNVNSNTKVLFVFHGGGRNAKDYRDAIIKKANEHQFIAIVPEFSIENFPGGDGYNLGNVFIDGDNPTANTLNPKNEWTFSIVESIFDFVKQEIENTSEKYQIIGHSAGAQFAHRLFMFIPSASYDKIVLSSAGWYTVPNFTIDFPYGYQKSPLENININDLFSKKIFIQVGEYDNDPNASGLRRNQFADVQGINRFERAYHFYDKAKELADLNNISFNWKVRTNLGLNHDYKTALTMASDLIFK
ncbi:hypothetical protein [Polaribacter porphyrae]|uniref:Alpha/beta hydrolase n=1 Tax=Polaribacter porphyrae TaxID=1137780 RepID=A0A2S7WQ24_9FLAO|nr:hypothetical protein [Polaribacter porphyrae]PQJ79699.1 hypothetical protein BTO18_11175 [Polaribacter porphyrae]